jgi:hypothetical protein
MRENLDTGRGPAPQAHSALGAQQLERSFRELFDRRDKQHLGSTFHVIGDIRNFVPNLDNNFKVNKYTKEDLQKDSDSNTTTVSNTRVMVWNAGGGAGTLKDMDKLKFLCLTMLQQNIHIACLCEGNVTKDTLWGGVKQLNMQAHFRAFGRNGTVTWLVQTDMAEKVQAELDLDEERVSGIVLAGACGRRTLILGVYGVSGATSSIRAAERQQALWKCITPLVELRGKTITFRLCPDSTRPRPPEGGGGGSKVWGPLGYGGTPGTGPTPAAGSVMSRVFGCSWAGVSLSCLCRQSRSGNSDSFGQLPVSVMPSRPKKTMGSGLL